MHSSTVPRPTRMTADERRDAIVAAAVEEFATGGLVGASTEAIAKRAGVSQPYVFQLFGTKKDLFLAVVRRCFAQTRSAFESAANDYVPEQIPDCNTVLEAIGHEYMRMLANRTNLLVQLQAYAACADPDVRDVVRVEFSALHQRVRELSGRAPRSSTISSRMGCSSTWPPRSRWARRSALPPTSTGSSKTWRAVLDESSR